MSDIIGGIQYRLNEFKARRRFKRSLKHVHGPREANTPMDAIVVVSNIRNMLFYVEEFLSHYRGLGVTQFVFCDNGSDDGTIERLTQENDCVVMQSTLPWGEVETIFRQYATQRYAKGRWCLYADQDEIFTFPGAEKIGLPDLAKYLDGQGATALVAQMLELVPKAPLTETANLSYADALKTFTWYDLRDVERYDYYDPATGFAWFMQQNEINSPELKVMFGGLRKRVFKEHCCLTKHPFVKVMDGVVAGAHPHASTYVRCADMTGLIKHYKFAGDTAARDADSVGRGVSVHGEDSIRLKTFSENSGMILWSEDAHEYDGFEPLYDAGFMLRSEAYEAYLEEVCP